MLNYNAGTEIDPSSIDHSTGKPQMNTFFWLKKSIIEAQKDQYFTQLASTINMPKHFGKTIKVYEYVPLLDDRNINDQGLDANGAKLVVGEWAAFNAAGARVTNGAGATADGYYASEAAARTAAGAGGSVAPNGGNLYGSSKDVGAIVGKIPTLTENGGRVNRVGFTRLQREGSLHKFGFFYEWTKESLDFDSDSELKGHLARELLNGAVQMTEAILQKDLLSAAGVILYTGDAVSDATITGEGAEPSLVAFEDFVRMDQTLTDNRCPRQTKVITGSRLEDTKTIPAARVAFVGSEIVPHLKAMKDQHGNPAFIAVQHYADGGTVLRGEIGTVDAFRIVQVPEMQHWAGVGAAVVSNPGFRETGGNYDVFPILVVGDDSFSTIGFQTDGKSAKFNIITKMPGNETADYNDPYGEKGFSSIKWYYGFLTKRPERIGVMKTVAPV